MVFRGSFGRSNVLGVFRDPVDRMEEDANFWSSPELLLDAIDFHPALHTRFIRRHARATKVIDDRFMSSQFRDTSYRLHTILEELCTVTLSIVGDFEEGMGLHSLSSNSSGSVSWLPPQHLGRPSNAAGSCTSESVYRDGP